jgi:hypothetical protein
MKQYRFYKDDIGWFVDLPEWTGEKGELQMVCGADTFCDILSQGENEIHVTLSTEPFNGCDVLDFLYLGRIEGPEMGSGAWYILDHYADLPFGLTMWLCDVTKFVFGDFPSKIYFK